MKNYLSLSLVLFLSATSCMNQKEKPVKGDNYFPYFITEEKPDMELSAATKRMFDDYEGYRPEENELYTNFKYTKINGFDYNGGDGTISRRDPSRVIKYKDNYYIYYTHRQTPVGGMGIKYANDTIPSADWDLAEVWYATSKDGFNWEEKGVAIPRPPKPQIGWRAVCTPDIFYWKGKYYLYYQAFNTTTGTRGDDCPISVSVADTPDGPWIPTNKIVVDNGPEGTWDQYSIHDPYPIVFNDKIYMYYKSDYNGKEKILRGIGLAIADNPLGPFKKHPLNPVLNSGHEVTVFKFREGIAAIAIRDGHERNTVQYSDDGVNFHIKSVVNMPPVGAGPYMPEAFTNEKFANGITWGVCHNKHNSTPGKRGSQYSIIMRFDCDLSLEENDKAFKETELFDTPEEQYRQGLTKKQKERILKKYSLK